VKLEIITPEKRLFDARGKLVQVPGTNGSFEILKNHAAIISTLANGIVKVIAEDDRQQLFEIKSGIVEVKANHITILAVT